MVTIQKPSKKILISSVILLVIAGALLAFFYFKDRSSNQQSSPQPNTATQNDINLAPPTEEDKKNVETNKEKIVNRDEELKNNPDDTSKKNVTPNITYAGKYGEDVEVGGYINGVFEDDGTCTATLTKDSQKVTEQVTAIKNVNSMDCPAIVIPVIKFPSSGEWSLTLSYSSVTASGNSEVRKLVIGQ